MTSTHDLLFETADGEVSAHEQILTAASPVLKAMLESIMKEGSSRRIQIKDSSESGVSLFLDTGAHSAECFLPMLVFSYEECCFWFVCICRSFLPFVGRVAARFACLQCSRVRGSVGALTVRGHIHEFAAVFACWQPCSRVCGLRPCRRPCCCVRGRVRGVHSARAVHGRHFS